MLNSSGIGIKIIGSDLLLFGLIWAISSSSAPDYKVYLKSPNHTVLHAIGHKQETQHDYVNSLLHPGG